MPVARSRLTLARPRTLREALRLLAAEPLEPIAGCTDVYVGLQFGTARATRFLDLWGLDELRGIRRAGSGVRVGALATYTESIRSRLVQTHVPMLAAAAREVGGAQIQNRGTIGGNVANASPAGDTLPVLAAAGARVVLVSQSGERAVPLAEFYTGYRATVRRADELIARDRDSARSTAGNGGARSGTRRAQAISKVMMAGVRGGEVRIALGAVAPTVVLAPGAARC